VPPSELNYFHRRLAHGRQFFLALDGEKLAAYSWITTQVEFAVDKIDIPLQPGDAYMIGSYTIPNYRRQTIQTALHLHIFAYIKSLGYRRVIATVAEDNVASQRMVRKLGYQDVARYSARRILWKWILHYHPEVF